MSDTPRTDAAVSPTALLQVNGNYTEIVSAVFSRRLERELAAALAQRDKAVAALKAQWHYSDHTNQCAIQAPAPDEEPLCDCGYDEAKLLYDEAIKECGK